MSFLDSLQDVSVDEKSQQEDIIIWTDDPNKAIALRNKCRADGHKCTIRLASGFVGVDPADTRRENDVEECTMILFLGAARKESIRNAYRQLGYRNVVFKDVPVGKFGEPVAVPKIEPQKHEPIPALDISQTMAAIPDEVVDEPDEVVESEGDYVIDPLEATDPNDLELEGFDAPAQQEAPRPKNKGGRPRKVQP